jgi:hypothetical protein
MLERFEACARAHGATQIGGTHVLEVILEERYYVKLAAGLQGGEGWGHKDPVADPEIERDLLLNGTEQAWRDYALKTSREAMPD